MKKLFLILNCLIFVVIMGCSTMKGIGDDIGTLGDWMKNGADKVMDK